MYVAQNLELRGGDAASCAKMIRTCFGRDIRMDECTKTKLAEFRDFLKRNIAPNTAKTYLNALKAFFNLYSEEEPIPCQDKSSVLYVKRVDSVNVFLTKAELIMIESAIPRLSPTEKYYAIKFLVGAYTGCRQSDILHITPSHVVGGNLIYVAEKTGKKVTVPITQKTMDWISYVNEFYDRYDGSLSSPAAQRTVYNRHIKKICKRCFINEPVSVVRGGREYTGPKYKYVSSHAARRSFATNLYLAGMEPHQISKLLGHYSGELTLKFYICAERTIMPDAARAYFE